jgi:hypothetical protein
VSGTLSTHDLLAKRFQHTDIIHPDISEDVLYQAIHELIADHNAIMRALVNDLAGFTTGCKQGPQAMKSEDAAALRVISDQLEERGDDAGAACLRDVAGRLEAMSMAGPLLTHWPKDLGTGMLRVRTVEVKPDRVQPHEYRLLIDAEPVGDGGLYAADDPGRPAS